MKTVFKPIGLFLLISATLSAQNESKIIFSGFIDTYYSYDFNKPGSHEKPSFLYNYTRHNEINVNLGLLKAYYDDGRVRANLGLMVGTYAQYNLAAEQELMKNIYEANFGIKLSEKAWLDAGIMSSHIGCESAISNGNPTLTRSMAAENSPYYLAAVKLSYAATSQWNFSFLVFNGWQRIKRVDTNSTPALGLQAVYKPSDKWTINYSNFIGNDRIDSAKAWRFFNDAYVIYQWTDALSLTAGFDLGIEQRHKGASSYNQWYTWTFIARYQWSDRLATAGRVEQFMDKDGVIIASSTPHGFQTWGVSVNCDLRFADNAWLRTEIRDLTSRDKIFVKGNSMTKTNLAWTTSLAVTFE